MRSFLFYLFLKQAEKDLCNKKAPKGQLSNSLSKVNMNRTKRGSVFKKIEGIGAGRLIEQVGLKGYRIGGIQSSEQHANFLINNENGTASEVVALINLIQEKVKTQTGHRLETEISFVGEF